jgi:hypothetical protein
VAKISPEPHFICSKVKIKGTKKGRSVIQFTCTLIFGKDQAACTWRNCLAGIGKDGPWAMPPQTDYNVVAWNKSFSEELLKGFRKAGYLDKIVPVAWAEEEDVTVEF